MIFRYPKERRGSARAEGVQPFKDARESMAESEAEIQDNANQHADDGPDLTEEEQNALQEQAAEERFAEIVDEEEGNDEN
ncbi:MAG: hypothetical protein H0V98_10570 [Chloroflexia bacterium]|nr:hypothetical protein [Chloroflexia bacterium]